jgi:uncharacterized DUF497 family protein
MSMLFIRKILWDSWNIKHIARHHITPEEVESIFHKQPLVLRGQQKKRLVVIGLTQGNRMITVVIEAKGYGKYYPVTAFEPDASDIALYKRLKGGEKNEK